MMKRLSRESLIRSSIIGIVLLVVGSPLSLYAQLADYVIGKGDQLLVTVVGYSEFNTTGTVKENGAITMPLLGDVPAAGMTKEAFISSLRRRLAEYIQGEVNITVTVVTSFAQRVTVMGSVGKPDNYPIAGEVSLLEMIAMAGGFLPEADLGGVKIFRKDKTQQTTEVDLEDVILRQQDPSSIPKVQAGDVVFVPRQRNFVRELSEFFRDVAFFFALFRLSETTR